GGMGVVYRGVRVGLDRPVAIKFLHRSAARVSLRRRRFEREARAMARLAHPNLVSVIDHGSHAGVPYLVMDYQEGASLRQALPGGALEPARAVAIARQIAAGLGGAHEQGVVHRDLKPENVFLVAGDGGELVKILDFGVAKLMAGDESDITLTGQAPGTPEYMAPEQCRCERVDARADLYSAGVILYEMLTGRRPFEGGSGLVVAQMQVDQEPLPPRRLAPDLSEELEEVVLRALEKDRGARWQTAGDLVRALAATPEGARRPLPVRAPSRAPTAAAAPAAAAAAAQVQDSATGEAIAEPRRARRIAALLVLTASAGATWVALERDLVPLPSWLARPGGAAPAQDAAPAPPLALPPIDA